jgi:hypothetical protein
VGIKSRLRSFSSMEPEVTRQEKTKKEEKKSRSRSRSRRK